MEDFIAQIEQVRSDASLSPEEKKKQLRKLRKQIRKSAGYQRQPKSPLAKSAQPAVSMEDLIKSIGEFISTKKLKEFNPVGKPGMAFSMVLSAGQGVSDPQAFFTKFEQRWGQKPTEYCWIELPKETLFLLGPVNKGDIR